MKNGDLLLQLVVLNLEQTPVLQQSRPRFVKIGRRGIRYDLADLAPWLAKHLKMSASDP
jgi:hypothetical protein